MAIRRKKTTNWFVNKFRDIQDEARWLGWFNALTLEFIRPLKRFIKNFLFPYNVIKIKTLSRGYQETDELILHGMFQLLTNFVEKQWIGHKYQCYGKIFDIDEETEKLIKEEQTTEFIKDQIDAFKTKNEETQAIWDLHTWWTKTRPNRNPVEFKHEDYDTFKFIPVLDDDGNETDFSQLIENADDPVKLADWKEHTIAYRNQTKQWDDEDEAMIQKLIKVRRSLWT